nr:unnamed protein product [Digitaria exilis]
MKGKDGEGDLPEVSAATPDRDLVEWQGSFPPPAFLPLVDAQPRLPATLLRTQCVVTAAGCHHSCCLLLFLPQRGGIWHPPQATEHGDLDPMLQSWVRTSTRSTVPVLMPPPARAARRPTLAFQSTYQTLGVREQEQRPRRGAHAGTMLGMEKKAIAVSRSGGGGCGGGTESERVHQRTVE